VNTVKQDVVTELLNNVITRVRTQKGPLPIVGTIMVSILCCFQMVCTLLTMLSLLCAHCQNGVSREINPCRA